MTRSGLYAYSDFDGHIAAHDRGSGGRPSLGGHADGHQFSNAPPFLSTLDA